MIRLKPDGGPSDLPVSLSTMSDDLPFCTPSLKPTIRGEPPREAVWTVRKDQHTRTCELVNHGEFGIEAQICIDGDLLIRRHFKTRALALYWAELERST